MIRPPYVESVLLWAVLHEDADPAVSWRTSGCLRFRICRERVDSWVAVAAASRTRLGCGHFLDTLGIRGYSVLKIVYRDRRHEALPHIVRFSGGRSSAAMLFLLAESGALDPHRGDVVLFANTSAEHPGTYSFAAECKRRLERDHGLPFLWYEFCTVEDASRGGYSRRLSYRLVGPRSSELDPDGYRCRGEVFEEMLSFQGMLPNPMSRSCTAKLKLYPQHILLGEWIGRLEGPSHEGHYAEQRFVSPERAAASYRKHGGTASREDFIARVAYMTACPPARAAQKWGEFTEGRIWGGRNTWSRRPAVLWGGEAAQFVTLLGLRADEPSRVRRVLSRSFFAEDAPRRRCSVRTQPPGERPYFPLFDAGLGREEILDFWRQRDFDLHCPQDAGNCVFCFMKGTRTLQQVARAEDAGRVRGAPSDADWWVEIERRYRREAPRRNGEGMSRFGFLGVSGPTFAQIAAGTATERSRFSSGTPACDCTD